MHIRCSDAVGSGAADPLEHYEPVVSTTAPCGWLDDSSRMRTTMSRMDFDISVDIAAPPDIVWAVMSDVERWHEWTPSVRSIRLLDKGPLAIGSRALIRQPRFPPALWKVTEIENGRGFTWRTGSPGMWVDGRHSIAPAPGGSRVDLHLHYEGALGRLLARLTRGITNRYLGFEAAGLKQRSEQRAASPATPTPL